MERNHKTNEDKGKWNMRRRTHRINSKCTCGGAATSLEQMMATKLSWKKSIISLRVYACVQSHINASNKWHYRLFSRDEQQTNKRLFPFMSIIFHFQSFPISIYEKLICNIQWTGDEIELYMNVYAIFFSSSFNFKYMLYNFDSGTYSIICLHLHRNEWIRDKNEESEDRIRWKYKK